MPRFDRTGPRGEGPLTGRGFGPCGYGDRRGFGRGFERGFERRQFCPFLEEPIVITKEKEKELLKEDIKALEEEKEYIEKRIKEIKEYIEKKKNG